MKKVGLITYYGENYGGMLQAYALQRHVRDLGYDCGIIDNSFLYTGSGRGGKAILRKLGVVLKNPVDYMRRRNQMRRSAGQRAQKSARFAQFAQAHLRVDPTGFTSYEQYVQTPPEYDIYLCGSDQIWNPNLYSDNGFYFAGFAPENKRKLAYASSIGVSSVTAEQAAFMKPFLERLDVISTRETDGTRIVEEITGKPARTVIDPTLLLNTQQWSEVAAPRMVEEPYVFCYFFGERDYYEQVKETVKKLTGLKLVSIPYVARELSDNNEKIYDAGPAEFVSLIQHASLVLTDSFHATVFSLNFKTPFLTLCRFAKNDPKGMNSRLNTILSAVGLEERLMDEHDCVNEQLLQPMDFTEAHRLLQQLRDADNSFLKDMLEN